MSIDAKILNKKNSKSNPTIHKINYTPQPSGICPRYAKLVWHLKISYLTHHINRLKKKNHVVLSIDSEKAFNKIPSFFMIKTLSKLEIERHSNLINNICKTPTASIILNGEKFPTKTRLKARISPITTAFQHCIESLD